MSDTVQVALAFPFVLILYALFVMAAQLLWILPLVFVLRFVFGGKK